MNSPPQHRVIADRLLWRLEVIDVDDTAAAKPPCGYDYNFRDHGFIRKWSHSARRRRCLSDGRLYGTVP
jgi:hypothetical protein